MTTPIIARTIPIHILREIVSLIVTGDNIATHSGTVETNTAELATVVYSKDVIQVAKWSAKNNPDNKAKIKSRRGKENTSFRFLDRAKGPIAIVARASR